MQWFKRIGIYLIGLALGTLVVSFFWKQKNVAFDYLPNARTLKTLKNKPINFTEEAKKNLLLFNIDTAKVTTILKNGDVNFSKSKPRLKPHPYYYITGKDSLKNTHLYVKRLDSTIKIEKVIVTN